jgi:cell division protein FtsA
MHRHAEALKVRFGSALASESRSNEVVCIPGLRGRDPKEITLHNLASIIQARMEEIIELVNYEIKNSGFAKKLIGGIVVTGGGSQLKHLTQLFEYMTGMDTRIGYPTEHLANTNNLENLASPMYATGIGLVLNGFQKMDGLSKESDGSTLDPIDPKPTEIPPTHSDPNKRGKFFDRILKKTKDFFDDNEENEN